MPAPDDIYKNDVDFTALALRYPDFAKKLKSNRQLDFSDPESVLQLTKALLHRDFNITIDLPDDRLCPPVPNRFNYVLFIRSLLDSSQSVYDSSSTFQSPVIGLDIGTGASAVYPLLALRQHPSWLFLATEIDEKSRISAQKNISANKLDHRIRLIGEPGGCEEIVPWESLRDLRRIDILMTNPPFYSSEVDLQRHAKQKSRPPNSACTGAPIEMICSGGEVSFVSRIFHESRSTAARKHKVRWYSAMLGMLSSVASIVETLQKHDCDNYAVTEFVQGQKTRRWCVAWSWYTLRPSNAVARGTNAVEKKLLPTSTEYEISFVDDEPDDIIETIDDEIAKLEGMKWLWKDELKQGTGVSASGDVWSRKARRRRQHGDNMDVDHKSQAATRDDEDEEEEQDDVTFAFRISVLSPPLSSNTTVNIRWLQGKDPKTFESLTGWLTRKVKLKQST